MALSPEAIAGVAAQLAAMITAFGVVAGALVAVWRKVISPLWENRKTRRGLFPFGGATMRFVERAGWGNAMRWLLTGGEFDGKEALRIGLVQELRPAAEVQARALELAREIAKQAPLAVQATRASSMRYAEAGEAAAIADFPDLLRKIAHSEDFAEGVRSFVERRDANFKGK